MNKNLLIVESPSKAKTIEKYLGKDWRVLATYGHVRDLPSKTGSVEPEKDFFMHYELIARSKRHIDAITDYIIANNNDINVFLATDPDREGEAIAWHVVECLKFNKKIKINQLNIKRAVFNAITKDLIKKAISEPRDIDQNLVHAQQSRLALDYLVGFTISPILWKTVGGAKASAGRVQSVALRVIVERELEILKFESKEYWSIQGNFKIQNIELNANLVIFDNKKLEKFSFTNEKQTNDAIKIIESYKQYLIKNIEYKKHQKHPYAPFTTASLQQEGSKRLNFNSKFTMSIAQKLYEGVNIKGENIGLITYMRTDGVYIMDDAINDIRSTVEKQFGKEYLHKDKRIYANKIKNAQEAHEAIRPTNLNKDFSPEAIKNFLNQEEYALYNLIWKRTLASQMASALYDVTNVIIINKEETVQFKSTFSNLSFDGYLAIYEYHDDEEENTKKIDLSKLKIDEAIDLKKTEGKQHFTEPPARFTEAALIKKMEEIGIGRPSTYATIISVLQTREYVKLNQKRFFATIRGHVIANFLIDFFSKYFAYDFTANMENELDSVASGETKSINLLNNFWEGFNQNAQEVTKTEVLKIMTQVSSDMQAYLFPRNSETNEIKNDCKICEEHGRENGKVSLKFSRFGYFLGCSNYPECQFIKSLSDNLEENISTDQLQQTPEEYIFESEAIKVKMKSGRFGPYLEIIESTDGNEHKRNVGLSNEMLKNLNQELIEKLIKLPLFLGNHPDDKAPINVNLGPYGYYIAHNKSFASISKNIDPFSIKIDQAIELLEKNKEKIAKNTKTLESKKHGELKILKGGFGKLYLLVDDTKKLLPKSIAFDDPDISAIEKVLESGKKKVTKVTKKK